MAAISLRDYQQAGVDGIRAAFRRGDMPVLFVLSTGAGKTYTFSYIAASSAEKGNPVIIIVHRKELLLQASQALTNLGIAHGMISPHFTADPRQNVQVASVDTLLIRLKKHFANPNSKSAWLLKFKLCIFDEAHHVVAANKWGRAWDQLGQPAMLGVTATPVRGDGKGLGDHCGGVFKEMVIGPSIVVLIGRGMLLNPIVYTSLETPDLDGLKTNSEGDYNLADLAQRVDKPRITGSAVKQYTKICPGARAIVFCASIAHARHVVEQFNAAGYRFALLVGQPEMSDAERTDVNKRLRRGELDGACTVDLVSEGYDLPDLACCIMLRPTASEALFLQQVGRVMRPSDGKVSCWLLDHVGNVGSIQDGEFKRKHGMPNEEREWTLDGKAKGKGKKKVEKVIDVFQCPKCYLAHMPEPTCPGCGHVYEIKTRQLEEVDGELHQLTPEMAEAIKRDKKVEVGKAREMDDLLRIEKERGYKKGWAKHTFESRKRKKPKAPERPPEPTLDELKAMTLEQLERVAREQNWGRDFASDFYHSQHALEGSN
jgi:superfamily II DNA or RNA helicase